MPITRKAFDFFRANAGGVVGYTAHNAITLARAEAWAKREGIRFVWEPDDDADWSWMDDDERKREHTVEGCRAVRVHECERCGHETADTLASLWGIFDADNAYRRVVEAELALEAMLSTAKDAVVRQ